MEIREDIKAYIDGELTEARAAQVREALASDPALKAEYESMLALTASVKALGRTPNVVGAERALASVANKPAYWKLGLVGTTWVAFAIMVVMPFLGRDARTESQAVAYISAAKSEPMVLGTKGKAGGEMFSDSLAVDGSPSVEGGEAPKEELAFDSAQSPELLMNDSKLPSTSIPPEIEARALLDQRLVVKNASFSIEVGDVQESMDKATHLTKAMNGFIESSNKNENEGKGRGYMTLRVPQDKFEATVEQLRGYGEVKGESASGDDVTTQVADIDARLRTLKSEEESYREIMRQARRIADIISVRERISQVRQEIESLTAQQATLRRLAALATINLEFQEEKKTTDEPKPDDWFKESTTSAVLMLKSVGKFLVTVGVYVVTMAPVWLPLVGLALWARRRPKLTNPF